MSEIEQLTKETPPDPYFQDLYNPLAKARQIPDLDSLTPGDENFYKESGYLSVARAFSPAEMTAAMEGLLHLIGGGNPEFKGIIFEASVRDVLDTLTLDERQDKVRKLAWFVEFEPRLKAIAQHPALLAAVGRLLGDSPVLFQDMALLKPPHLGTEKPWHQDLSYFNFPHTAPVVGVWIALDEATIANGCMQLLPGEHREPILHWKRRDWQICDSQMQGKRSTAVPLKPGGLLLFDGLLPHGTPHNHSGQRRRALQFHYTGAKVQGIAATERMRVFGSEGKDVTC